jgi:putative flavoprotein involved in K+ transport
VAVGPDERDVLGARFQYCAFHAVGAGTTIETCSCRSHRLRGRIIVTRTRIEVLAQLIKLDSLVIVVGAGQADLAVSHGLITLGIDHVVVERARVGETWRGLWDSFCLVTPNWTMSLPGAPYAGDDPEGFVPRNEIIRYLERYASTFGMPVREGVAVDSLEPAESGEFLLRTSVGDLHAEVVVVCTGAYQRPHRPDVAAAFPQDVLVIDAEDYRNPAVLPPGRVLVVGSGQAGCQISEELHKSGREVFLACGRAPWMPRRADGRDIVTWVTETTFLDMPLSALQSTGARGGHDLHYRTLQAMGVQLLGRLVGVEGHRAYFADDLADSVAFGDARYRDIRQLLSEQLTAKGMRVPGLPDPPPFHAEPPPELDLEDFGVVIFTCGFRPDYARWVRFPAFDAMGFPLTDNGASTVVPGLFFCGVHFMRKRKSSLLFGVGEDAAIVAQSIARKRSRHDADR